MPPEEPAEREEDDATLEDRRESSSLQKYISGEEDAFQMEKWPMHKLDVQLRNRFQYLLLAELGHTGRWQTRPGYHGSRRNTKAGSNKRLSESERN